MRGILLAGGRGTRLWPMTASVSKQLLPIYDKPMIYYPLTTLMLAGVMNISIIVNPEHLNLYKNLLGTGNQWGLHLDYIVQERPTGIPDSLLLIPKELRNESVILVLGDNFLYGMGLGASLKSVYDSTGALIFGYHVSNPQDYGVVKLNELGKPTQIVEKPASPISNLAIPGVYFLDNKCYDYAANLIPSARGETEIVELLSRYLNDDQLTVVELARGTAWLDTGGSENLLEASEFVRVLEKRQGLKIGSPEEVSFREGLIDSAQLRLLIKDMPACEYSAYLSSLSEEDSN
jgi:glucose-1-phosphate thymidylyltransferase